MKRVLTICGVVLAAVFPALGQVTPSHSGTPVATHAATGKPVVRVNGTVLTDRDLLREMYTIFPYARQHNGGFPKEMEPQIRNGALQMIIFEELVYQDALQRKMSVGPAKMQKAEAEFEKQFSAPEEYESFLNVEFHGSVQLLRQEIRRSLLIDELLGIEVNAKSAVTTAEAKAYYDKNPGPFEYPDSFAFQTISVLPPQNATPNQLKEGRQRAEDALRQAKATKSYEEFGLLAEKISDDDYRVMMGDHKFVPTEKLAPVVVQAMLAMQPGQVSGILQIEQAYTIVRFGKHQPAGKKSFLESKNQLKKQLEQQKKEQLRAALNKELRSKAKVEAL